MRKSLIALFAAPLLFGGAALAQDDPMLDVDAPPVADPTPVDEAAEPMAAEPMAAEPMADEPMAAEPEPVAAPDPVDEIQDEPAPGEPPAPADEAGMAEPMPATAEPMPATAEPMPEETRLPMAPEADGPYYNITPAEPERRAGTRKVKALNRGGQEVEVREGPYLGVQPGVNDYVPRHKDLPLRQVTWVGFQMIGDGGRVFIQTDAPKQCNVTPNDTRTVLTLECDNTKLRTRNDGHRLDTRFFPSAVTEINATQGRDKITRITITLREPVGYDRSQQGNYQIFDFQKPSDPSTPKPSPAGS